MKVQAHPRSRGENSRTATPAQSRSGSSPLTRGKRQVHSVSGHEWGLIPAHAGKTCVDSVPTALSTAHPRSRGENGGRVAGLRGLRGSSPLTRGKLISVVRVSPIPRLIPAHAGKTLLTKYPLPNLTAHPRSRGENCVMVGPFGLVWGSSPLTRGKLAACQD